MATPGTLGVRLALGSVKARQVIQRLHNSPIPTTLYIHDIINILLIFCDYWEQHCEVKITK